MSEIKINKESFENVVSELNTLIEDLNQFNKQYFEDLEDVLSNNNSSMFTASYRRSLETLKEEWNDKLVDNLKNFTTTCSEVSDTFEGVDITISTTVNNGGSF